MAFQDLHLGHYGIFVRPIGVLIFFSFNQSKSRSNFTGFTLDWYVKLFHNDLIIQSLINTLIVALVSSIIATVIGTIAAVGINSMKNWQKIHYHEHHLSADCQSGNRNRRVF